MKAAAPSGESDAALKARIRVELPANAFAPQPLWALPAVPLVGAIAGTSVLLATLPLPWYAGLAGGVFLGLLYASLTFLGHEVAHGTTVGPGPLREGIVYLAFAVYCISPHLWRVWHHRAHHAHTNMAGHDPDNFGTLDEFRRHALWCRILYRLAPGMSHGICLAFIFLCFFFTLQGQGMLWSKSKRLPDFAPLRRRRAIVDSAGMALVWIGIAMAAGPAGAVYVVLVPMFVANAVVSSYIITTHMLCPLVDRPDTLKTTMSVTTPRIVDLAHFHFSHHVEHHLFPGMCSRFYPLVRRVLVRDFGGRYLAPPYWRALGRLIVTPRIYDGPEELVDPFSGKRVDVLRNLARLRPELPGGT